MAFRSQAHALFLNLHYLAKEFLYEMAIQPHIQQKLREELLDFEAHHGAFPSFNDLTASGKEHLRYLDAVTMETMRCKAVLMDISRMFLLSCCL